MGASAVGAAPGHFNHAALIRSEAPEPGAFTHLASLASALPAATRVTYQVKQPVRVARGLRGGLQGRRSHVRSALPADQVVAVGVENKLTRRTTFQQARYVSARDLALGPR